MEYTCVNKFAIDDEQKIIYAFTILFAKIFKVYLETILELSVNYYIG